MPQILNHRKVKKSQKRVLVKRKHFLTNYHETKSYKPCEFQKEYMSIQLYNIFNIFKTDIKI